MDSQTRQAARLFLKRIAGQYDLGGAVLFGSRARSDHRPDSDLDIAVILNGPHGDFLDTKLALADIAYEVLLETGIHIQPMPIWEDQWKNPQTHINPDLLKNIQRDGMRL